MPRLLPFVLAAALAAPFSASVALAETAEFRLWDLDQDKRVTLTEIENRLLAVMAQFDKDGDGALNNEEYDAFDAAREAEAKEHNTSLSLRAVGGLSRGNVDSNFDGMVTREELLEAGRRWFTQMDRNGDGQIDANDFPNALDFTKDN